MPLMTLMTAALLGMGPHPVTTVRPIADVVEIRPQMLDTRGHRRDAVRDAEDAGTAIVGQMSAEGEVSWVPTRSNRRQMMGGQDAPALIYVRVFDGVFAIDPFEPLPVNSDLDQIDAPINEITARMLFNGSSLETDRALFDRRRIERTEELFEHLERARRAWLRSNGFAGVATFTNPAAEGEEASVESIEPSGWFRKPAEMPRGKSREAVQAEPAMSPEASRAVAASVLEGATRVSVPHGMDRGAAERLARVAPAGEEPVEGAGEVASRE